MIRIVQNSTNSADQKYMDVNKPLQTKSPPQQPYISTILKWYHLNELSCVQPTNSQREPTDLCRQVW